MATPDQGEEICTIRIDLVGADPPIWREVEVPTALTLKNLHDVVQIVMGWEDHHLWEFSVGRLRYGPPMERMFGESGPTSAARTRLRDVLKPRKTTIGYMYDFGDSWEHRLTVTRIRPGEPGVSYPRLTGGERNGPPDDCGGLWGFQNMLDALADPTHPEHDDLKEAFADYDAATFDVGRIRFSLDRIATRRLAGSPRRAKAPAPTA